MPKSSKKKPVEELFRAERVARICTRDPITAFPQTPLRESLTRLRSSGGCVIVVEKWGDHVKPIGILTERDYLVKIAGAASVSGAEGDLGSLPTERFMTPRPTTLSRDETLETAIQLMTRGGYRHLPLVDDQGDLAGVLSVRNIIVYLAELFPAECLNKPPLREPAAWAREGG